VDPISSQYSQAKHLKYDPGDQGFYRVVKSSLNSEIRLIFMATLDSEIITN